MTRPDSELCAMLACDLAGNFDHLVLRFQMRLFAFALRLTGNRPDAEDILQEAFIGAYVSLEQYSPERIRALQLQAWLYRIVLHTYQHHRRGAQVHVVPLSTEDDEAEMLVADTTPSTQDVIEQIEQQHEMQAILAQLPDRYRIPITCLYYLHLQYPEIADLLDQPLGTVKSSIHRGLRQLRGLLQERGDVSWNPPTPHAQNH
ncbi:MAG: RNA polymerase sigma factor [Ktedonobacterales bacterium]